MPHHLEDRRDAASRLAERESDGAVELDLGRRVRTVAELVLQANQSHRCCACRRPAAAARGSSSTPVVLREHQVRIALRCREEPLVTGEPVRAVGAALPRACGCCGRRIRPGARSFPCRSAPHAFRRPATAADRSRAREASAARPTRVRHSRVRAARAPPRTSSSTGTACRSRPAHAACTSPRARRAHPVAHRATATHARRPPSPCASARAMRDGTRRCPRARRSGRACEAAAGGDWRHPRARTSPRVPAARPTTRACPPPMPRLRARALRAARGRRRTGCGPRTAAAGSETAFGSRCACRG